MQLESYISELLYRYECVTVPGFGAFLSQQTSATVHESTDTFYPPKKLLSFNEQIQTNDGLLANYIADVEKIPFEQATKKIRNRVQSLKTFLEDGQTLVFNNIGELNLNASNKINFEPSYHLNYLTDAFGLSQFVSPAVTRAAYKENSNVLNEKAVIAFTAKKEVPTEIKRKKPYFKYAAVALIALTIGGVSAGSYFVNDINTHNQIAQEEANVQLENKIQEATFVINNPLPAITLKVNSNSGNYHIVAGAFRVEANSITKVEQLKAEGFNARKIGVNKFGLHQVAYSSFTDRTDALNALQDIRSTSNPEAWLLVKQLN